MAQPFQVRMQYFAAARELAGCSEETLSLPEAECSAQQLRDRVASLHPRLSSVIHRMRIAINDELVGEDACIRTGDQVALLPPVAGGGDASEPPTSSEPASRVVLCEVRDTPLSVDEVLRALRHPGAGGVALFVGVVRDHADGKSVARLDYEAHPTLALRELSSVLQEVAAEQSEAWLATVHRVGELVVGDLAIVVGASAAHREQAFAACREAIERIKQRVPIWKKEWAPDGSANWVNLT